MREDFAVYSGWRAAVELVEERRQVKSNSRQTLLALYSRMELLKPTKKASLRLAKVSAAASVSRSLVVGW